MAKGEERSWTDVFKALSRRCVSVSVSVTAQFGLPGDLGITICM